MIPLMMILRVRTNRGHFVRLWLPLFLLWLLVLPLLVLLAPFYLAFCIIARVNPLRWIAALWALLSATAGTHIEVDTPHACVFMHVY
ncbi:MAG: hypothetical protein KGJ79_04950 [Alphaproteobacteria bacterium]|nr:hypothetical protein [Alphaproteobacteria bacterium]MDE2110469.1 hypothetical protein [Alphaproteobacteria bacterium]MDE2493220.1 hypothetical protein [Alphaproteobacteria bacterium]